MAQLVPLVNLFIQYNILDITHSGTLFNGFGFRWLLDGMSLLFVGLICIVTPISIIASWNVAKRSKEFLFLITILEPLCCAVFLASNIVTFYIFFELSLIPMFFIIGIWGGAERIYACFKFALYTILGSLPLLLIIIVITYANNYIGDISSLILSANSGKLVLPISKTLIWFIMFFGFAIKLAMVPLHTWLPLAHVEAPTSGSILLAAIMIKMGGYAMLRIMLPLLPDISIQYQGIGLWFGALSLVYGSLVAFAQTDLKKVIAYSSIAHMGYVIVGVFSMTTMGRAAAIFQMISHGLISTGMFFLVGAIYDRSHTRSIEKYGGVAMKMPRYSIFFVIFTMASIALPGTSGFVGEFMSMNSLINYAKCHDFAIIFVMSSGIILGATYMLKLSKEMIFGVPRNSSISVSLYDISTEEFIICSCLVVGILIMGIYPELVLSMLDR